MFLKHVFEKCDGEVEGVQSKTQSHSFQLGSCGRRRRLKLAGKELDDVIIIFDAAFQKT